ncbi:MAG TPA: polymer-forming cytoskeletal protein, partial [Myxococcaceae bacterium]|nr:polymer-forming cytoskeletal protein [Myxococcaceae bacterium]
MKWFRMLCFVAATGAAVRQAPAHAATPAKKISIEYRGHLKDALKKIASQGGINLVASGDLSEEVEVLLYDVSPEEALKTLAANYHLRIDRSGSIWTLRPITAAEQVAMPASPPSPPAPPAPPAPEKEDRRPTEGDESSASNRAAREAEKALTDSSTDREKPLNRTELRKKLREIGKRGRHPGRNDRVAQGSLIVAEGETVRNATAMGGSLVVNGSVTGDAVALGGSVTVNGHVSGGVVAMGGGVHLGPNAVVEGDVVAVGGEVSKDEGAEVLGDQTSSGALASLGIDRLMQKITKDAAKMSGGTASEDTGHHPWLRGWHFGLPGFLLR